MPITHPFEYINVQTLQNALDHKERLQNRARILAGGTDLILNLKENLDTPEWLIDIKGIQELNRLEFHGGTLIIGANVTITEIHESPLVREKYPLLMEATGKHGSRAIRNRATMVGNICSAVPCLDSGASLLIYDAYVEAARLQSGAICYRHIPISDWFKSPKMTSIDPSEIITGIHIPLPSEPHAGCYIKLGRYRGEDLSQVGVAVMALDGSKVRAAFSAVGPVPIRATRIEALLNGNTPDETLMTQALNLIEQEIFPITDIRATREYRMHMAKVMFDRALTAAISRLHGNGPAYGTDLI